METSNFPVRRGQKENYDKEEEISDKDTKWGIWESPKGTSPPNALEDRHTCKARLEKPKAKIREEKISAGGKALLEGVPSTTEGSFAIPEGNQLLLSPTLIQGGLSEKRGGTNREGRKMGH